MSLCNLFNRRRKPHLMPCDNCLQMMQVNGYGLCEECLDAFDAPGNDFMDRWIAARSLDNEDSPA